MQNLSWDEAIRAWRERVGDEYVLTLPEEISPYLENVTASTRSVPAVLKPADTAEVQGIVEIANAARTPLYPFSTGKNWGFGSRLPSRDGSVLVDLSRMDRIRELNPAHLYAVIEPGVTQGQLYRQIESQGLPLTVNVTGSGADSSIIGNSLERGIGYFATRVGSLSSLEVVLGNGKMLKTGFSHDSRSAINGVYPHGIGPGLDSLFHQSNFGIVTAATFKLMPRADSHASCIASIRDDKDLPWLVDEVTRLRKSGVIQTVVHIANRYRTEISLGPLVYDSLNSNGDGAVEELKKEASELIQSGSFGAWSAVIGLHGNKAIVREQLRAIRSSLRSKATVRIITDRSYNVARRLTNILPGAQKKKPLLDAIEPLYRLSKGIPTDETVKSVFWPVGKTPDPNHRNPDHSEAGMLYAAPFAPAGGDHAVRMVLLIREIFERYSFVPYVTLNLVTPTALEGVISLAFDRSDPDRTKDAKKCIDTLTDSLIGAGYMPYRVSIDWMDRITDEDDVFWQTVKGLKSELDPNNIIAPGRYNLI